MPDSLIKKSTQYTRETSSKFYSLKLSDTLSLLLNVGTKLAQEDSADLQKGLVLFNKAKSLCGEGVGFGVPAVEYSDQVLFSTSASIQAENGILVKIFWMDAAPIKPWVKFLKGSSSPHRILRRLLVKIYRTDRKFRPLFAYLMKLRSLLGLRLSFQKVAPRGFIEVTYHLSGKDLNIKVDSSNLFYRNFKKLLIFNEQSASFNLYKDDLGILRKADIGVWEEVKSKRAYLANEECSVTFGVENICGTKLYRGRELLRPRLDWAGFCYSIPSSQQRFGYTIQISE